MSKINEQHKKRLKENQRNEQENVKTYIKADNIIFIVISVTKMLSQ